jgi:hypothetical protein
MIDNQLRYVQVGNRDELTDFSRRLAHMHAMRWRVAHRTAG